MSNYYPVLPAEHIWEIGPDYAAIWEKFPDMEDNGFPRGSEFRDSTYQERSKVLSDGLYNWETGKVEGYLIRRYDRKRRAFKRDVDWPTTKSTFGELSRVYFEWERSKQINYGFQDDT